MFVYFFSRKNPGLCSLITYLCTVRLLILKFSQNLNPENVIMSIITLITRVKRGIQYSPCMLIQLFSPCAFNIFLNIHPCVLISDWLLIRESRVCRKIQLYKGDRILSLTLLIHPLPPIIYHQWMFQIEVHTNFFGFKRQMIYYGYQMSHIF